MNSFFETKSNSESQHILVLEDSNCRRTIMLEESQYSLGRHSSCGIQITSAQASRHHATLVRKFNNKLNRDMYLIVDGDLDGNKSQNGVFINGSKCLVHELKDGDLINFGCHVNASYHCLQFGQSHSQSFLRDKNGDSFTTSTQTRPSVLVSEPLQDFRRPEEDTFEEQSYIDPSTNLPNQVLFLEYLNLALSNAERGQHQVGLILLQLKNWQRLIKDYSQSLSILTLSQIGQHLRQGLRNGDVVARWGENEFIILLSQIRGEENLEGVSQRLLHSLLAPYDVQGKTLQLEFARGSAVYPRDGAAVETLSKVVRSRLQALPTQNPHLVIASPDSGFFQTSQWDAPLPEKSTLNFAQLNLEEAPSAEAERERLVKVEKRIQRALRKSELELYFQPQVNLERREVETMEALIRWLHPTQGMIAPRQFLPWSDQTEMILPLTEWILQNACLQNRTWQSQGLPPAMVSVNLSSKQFYHQNLIALIQSALAGSQLAPQWLELEITETTILEDLDGARQILRELDERGARVCLDDFGVDYASIRYLQELPIHKFKIDNSLIQRLNTYPQDTALLEVLINLGRSFRIAVVAEGVENQTQLDILQKLRCPIIQGYYLSHPLNGLDAGHFLGHYHFGRPVAQSSKISMPEWGEDSPFARL
ncbi:MAG: EAL domain-containing protein [Cyanobacteria bacterium RI_101]|nr:EAL domain-containing protein [Cyanobacteria bacterium RI_101]